MDIFKSNSTGEDELIEACWDILLDSDIGLANEVLTCIEDRDNLVYISDVIDINHDEKSYIVELIEPNFKVITQLRIYYEERVDDTYPIFDIIGKGIEKFKVGKIIKLSPKAKSAAIWKLKGVNPSSLTKEVRYVFKNYTRKQIGNVVREASKWLRYSIQSSFVSSILSSF